MLDKQYPERVTLEVGSIASSVLLVLIHEDGIPKQRVLDLIDHALLLGKMEPGVLTDADLGAVQHFVSVVRSSIVVLPPPPSPWLSES